MKSNFVISQIPGEHYCIGVIPPQPAVLPVATQILSRGGLKSFPAPLDVIRASRTMNQTKRWPDGMIAAKNKTVSSASQNCLHPALVSLDSCDVRITKPAALHRAPEVGVEFKVCATPFLSHRLKDVLQVSLRFGIASIKRIPGNVTPTAKSNSVGTQRCAIDIPHEPVRMLFEDMRFLFSNERSHPDRWLKPAFADLLEHPPYIATKRRARFEPIAHRWLIAIINLNVFQTGRIPGNHVEVLEHLRGSDPRAKAVPGAPTGGRILKTERRVVLGEAPRQLFKQSGPVRSGAKEKFFKLPRC